VRRTIVALAAMACAFFSWAAVAAAAGQAGAAIDGSYIVTVKSGSDPKAVADGKQAKTKYVYRSAINGFAADKLANSGVFLAVAAGNESQRQRVQRLAGQRVGGVRDRGLRPHGPARLVLQLRVLRGRLRAGRLDHVDLEQRQHEHDQRNVDGDAARGGRRRALQGRSDSVRAWT
jgi:hypothetical protein